MLLEQLATPATILTASAAWGIGVFGPVLMQRLKAWRRAPADRDDGGDEDYGWDATHHQRWERRFVADLARETGRTLGGWLAMIDASGVVARNDILDLLCADGLPFRHASWIERIRHNGGRLIYGGEPGPESAAEPLPPAARVTAATPGPGLAESPVLARPGSSPARPDSPSSSRPGRADAHRESAAGRVFMRPIDHVIDFLSDVRANRLGRNAASGRHEARYCDKSLISAYRDWAARRAVVVIPDSIFLAVLAQQPGVEKSRDRIKDQETGRVVRNAAGTPLRATHYTVLVLAPEKPKRAPVSKKTAFPALSEAERACILARLEAEPVRRAA